jgi:hypothetical protein
MNHFINNMNNINVGDTFNLNLSSNQPIFTTWNARRRFLLTCGSEEPIAGDEIWSVPMRVLQIINDENIAGAKTIKVIEYQPEHPERFNWPNPGVILTIRFKDIDPEDDLEDWLNTPGLTKYGLLGVGPQHMYDWPQLNGAVIRRRFRGSQLFRGEMVDLNLPHAFEIFNMIFWEDDLIHIESIDFPEEDIDPTEAANIAAGIGGIGGGRKKRKRKRKKNIS